MSKKHSNKVILLPEVTRYFIGASLDKLKVINLNNYINPSYKKNGKLACIKPNAELEKCIKDKDHFVIPFLKKPYIYKKLSPLNNIAGGFSEHVDPTQIKEYLENQGYFKNELIINITKICNLFMTNMDYSTCMFIAKNDHITGSINISLRNLKEALDTMSRLNLIHIEKKRRAKNISLPQIIHLNESFFTDLLSISEDVFLEMHRESIDKYNDESQSEIIHVGSRRKKIESYNKMFELLHGTYEAALNEKKLNASQNEIDISASDSIGEVITDEDLKSNRIISNHDFNHEITVESTKFKLDILKTHMRNCIKTIDNDISYQDFIIPSMDQDKIGSSRSKEEIIATYKELEAFVTHSKSIAKKLLLSGEVTDKHAIRSLYYMI